jgi:hypothetical protein
MNTSAGVYRVPLDPWDELFHSISTEYGGTGNGAAVLHLRGTVEREPLQAALAALQQRHPKLRARIVESDGGRHAFEIRPDDLPLPFELKDVDIGDLPWQEESSRLLATSLNPAVDPLVRVVVLRARARGRCILVLMAHHAVGDGHSVMRLVDDLLGYYAGAEHGGTPAVAPLSIAAAPRALPSGTLWQRLRQSAALYRRRRDNRKADWVSLPQATGGSPHRLWAHFVLTERDTAALARQCRREKAALFGALYAAAARGLIAALGRPDARVKCRFPIDIRRRLISASGAVSDHDLGNFVSGYEAIYEVGDRSRFWTLARQARHDMERFTAGGGPSLVYNLIRFITLPYVPPTLRRGTILVNSYGVVDLRERYGSLGLEELSVVFNNVTAGPSLLIQGFVIQKRLNVSLSMVDVPEDFWERVSVAIKKEFQEATHGERDDERAVRARA